MSAVDPPIPSRAREARPEAIAQAVREWLRPHEPAMLAELGRLVAIDSASGDPEPLAATAAWLSAWFSDTADVERVRPRSDGPEHLLLEVGAPVDGAAPLVLCHYDTVWPAGTAGAWPFELDDGYARGPGVLDMKASIVQVRYALLALAGLGIDLANGARVLISGDEEIGNGSSRPLIEDLARRASAALVLEPPLADGRLKTQRKGHANVAIDVRGRLAHAGVEPEKGVSAAVEAAHLVLAAQALADPRRGTIVNVGVVQSGGRPNMVAETARLELEVRADDEHELGRVLDAMRGLGSSVPGTSIGVAIDVDRPPMPRVPRTEPLLALARAAGTALGLEVREGATGGVSEGNFTQAAGTPTLDGLGIQGVGAHSRHERILVTSLFERTALLGALMASLAAEPPLDTDWSPT